VKTWRKTAQKALGQKKKHILGTHTHAVQLNKRVRVRRGGYETLAPFLYQTLCLFSLLSHPSLCLFSTLSISSPAQSHGLTVLDCRRESFPSSYLLDNRCYLEGRLCCRSPGDEARHSSTITETRAMYFRMKRTSPMYGSVNVKSSRATHTVEAPLRRG